MRYSRHIWAGMEVRCTGGAARILRPEQFLKRIALRHLRSCGIQIQKYKLCKSFEALFCPDRIAYLSWVNATLVPSFEQVLK